MGVKRQQGEGDRQLSLFDDDRAALSRHGASSEGGTGPAACEEPQTPTALDPARALTEHLMEEVCQRDNLNQAYRRVKTNKGAAGVDGMTVHELRAWLKEHKENLIASLLDGSYQPRPVRGVEIRKPGGGVRQLGIPTVVDRLVQQAILQVLEPLLAPTFSASSYGFRPKRSAHNALSAARKYVADGRAIVVDLDLEKSAVAHVSERKFLGHRLLAGGRLGIAPVSLQRAKERIRQITRRNQGVSLERMISELNSFLTGWVTYFRHAACRGHLQDLDQWIRRKLRCVRLKQRKRAKSIAEFLHSLGVPKNRSWTTAACGKGWWRTTASPAAHEAMPPAWFKKLGLVCLADRHAALPH
ncbi:MAG: group II intron reverse transcriptase/maturase [Phycisphaerae bacterium]|nr:group II intron reverse transcriptase/maturase [Phycisphaerae bacterium]